MTKLDEIKRCRENAIDIEEFFNRLIENDMKWLNLSEDWESSYWKFKIKIKSIHNYIERLYEKERNIKCQEKNSKSEKTDQSKK